MPVLELQKSVLQFQYYSNYYYYTYYYCFFFSISFVDKMAKRFYSSNLHGNSNYTDIIKTVADTPPVLRAIYGVIGALAILSNGFFCFVILKTPRMLRSSYNVLILSLAMTDTATGTFLVVFALNSLTDVILHCPIT